MTKIQQLAELGQAIWLDYIRRSFVTSGGLQALVDQGLRGMTSNPTIFDKAIANSDDYDQALRDLVRQDKPVPDMVDALMVADIQSAADVLRQVYDKTAGADGYVSLEVNPAIAADTDSTIAQARRLFAASSRPNVFIKIPATPAGIPAIRTMIGEGTNINITLMFSMAHYEAVTEAYLAGLEHLVERGGDPGRVASVASFFVSRVDTMVDKKLEALGDRGTDLLGTIGIANSKMVYARFKEIFSSDRWRRLAARGAHIQRPLWASTSTKNPSYPDTLYADSLIGPMTVNTLPQETYDAFLDHGVPAMTVECGLDEARQRLARLAELGISLDQVTEQLQVDGVAAFAKSFENLSNSIAEKCEKMRDA